MHIRRALTLPIRLFRAEVQLYLVVVDLTAGQTGIAPRQLKPRLLPHAVYYLVERNALEYTLLALGLRQILLRRGVAQPLGCLLLAVGLSQLSRALVYQLASLAG